MSALINLLGEQDPGVFDATPGNISELMNEEDEEALFRNFRNTSANALHPGFSHESLYDRQRAVYRPLPSKQVKSTRIAIHIVDNTLAFLASW